MKVVIETTAHPGGGSITYLTRILNSFTNDGHEYTVIVPSGRNALTDIDAVNITFHETTFPVQHVLLREVYRQLLLPLLLLRSDADVLFSTGDITSFLAPIPSVVIVHNLAPYTRTFGFKTSGWPRIRNFIHRLLTWLSIIRAERVIWVSQFTAETVGDRVGFSKKKGTVIHHGIDTNPINCPIESSSPDISDLIETHQPYILTVSTVNKHKNYETLLKAYAKLSPSMQDQYDLIIVGRQPDRDYYEQLQRFVTANGLENSVVFLGGTPPETVSQLYSEADIYVLPSKIESFGLTPLEAMAAGIPVVAARSTSIPEICGNAAEYFDPDSVDQLVETLTRVLSDDAKRRELIEAGKVRVDQFSWEETATQTKTVLNQAAEGAEGIN